MRRVSFFHLVVAFAVLGKPHAAIGESSVEEQLKPVRGDEKSSDIRALKTELLVSKTEQAALQQINKLLSKYKGTTMEAGLLQRKAELFQRMSKTERFFELSRDSETVVSLAPARVKSASSRRYLSQAVETYDSIQRRFPKFENLDVVIFNNAFTRQQLDQQKIAENLYRDLIQRFPGSELVPDAHLAVGEMLFERKDFSKALAEFNKIKSYPQSRVYPYGLYKAGWTKYNLQDTSGGLRELEAVVAFGKKVEREGLDGRLDLRAEALNDMVLFYGDVGEPSNAYNYFRDQAGEENVGPYLLKLSGLYVRHSKHGEHEKVLRELVRRNPTSPSVPDAYRGLIENFESQRKRPEAVATLQEMDGVCSDRGAWAKVNVVKSKSEREPEANVCREQLVKVSLNFASKWNRMWKKNQTYTEFSDAAESAYLVYLKNAPSSAEAFETRFAYAELLFQRSKFRPASEQYAIVGRDSADMKLSHDSSYAAVVALEKAVSDKWSDSDEKTFQQLSQVYLGRHKEGKYATDLVFKRAFIAYEKSRYDEALPVFEDLGFKKKSSAFTDKAQSLFLDILNIKKQYTKLREFSGKLLRTEITETRKAQLKKVFEEASFAEAQSQEEAGDSQAASASFEAFAVQNPHSALADKAFWNSISLAQKSGQVGRSTDLAAQFYRKFPKSEFAQKAMLMAAQGYETMLQLRPAAEVLAELAVIDSAQSTKWRTLSADFSALAGDKGKAESIYRDLARSKDSSIAHAASAKLIALNTADGLIAEAWVQEILRLGHQPQSSLALAQLAERQFKINRHAEAFRTASDVLEMRRAGASQGAMARARLVQARILQAEFVAQSVKARPDRLATVLQLKTARLEKAQQAFQDVARMGDPKTGIEAMIHLNESFGHYVDSLRKLEIVGEISKPELEALRKELESLAMPIEDKRVDVLSEALKAAKRLDLRDGSVARIQIEINRLNMKRAPANQMAVQIPPPMIPKLVRPPQQTLGALQ